MTRTLHLHTSDDSNVLHIKTETGREALIPIAGDVTSAVEAIKTYIDEENERRRKEYDELVKLWRYRDRLEAQQNSLIARIIELTPQGTPVNYTQVGWVEDKQVSLIVHTMRHGMCMAVAPETDD